MLSGHAWRTAARSSSDDQLPCNGDPHGVGILHLSSTVLCRVFSSHTNSTSHLLVVRRKRSRLLRRHSVASSTEPHPPSPWALSTFRHRAHVQRRTARHTLEHNVVIVRTRASESSRGRGLDSGLSRAYVCPTEPVRPALNGIAGTHFVSRSTRSTARRLPAHLSCDALHHASTSAAVRDACGLRDRHPAATWTVEWEAQPSHRAAAVAHGAPTLHAV